MEKGKNISKRLSAYLLDIMLIYLLISLITSIRFINPTYDKFNESYQKYTEVLEKYYDEEITLEKMNELNEENIYNIAKYNISSNIVIIVVIFAYFGLFQKYNNGQTLGKKIMKIKVMSINDKAVSLGRYFLRILPMYYMFIGSVIPLGLNSILIFILDSKVFPVFNTIIVYTFFIISIISLIMMYVREDKRGIHDLISNTKVEFE